MEEKKCEICVYGNYASNAEPCKSCDTKYDKFVSEYRDSTVKFENGKLILESKKLNADKIITGVGKVQTHIDICRELNDIYIAKNKDYGDSFSKSFKEYGMMMPCIRLEDKLNRLKSITKNKEQKVINESIEDTLKDLANYAIMTLIELKNGGKE